MRLRNKKTGEIVEANGINFTQGHEKYNSLAEFTADWEDYEEPKGWCVTMYGGISRITKDDEVVIPDLKEIGNYFNDKESAYDALRKLKAWKRLKDKGFKLKGWYMSKNTLNIEIDGGFPEDVSLYDVMDDLDIVSGGEE